MWKILCAESAGRQLKLRNTSSSIVLPCAEEEARIWKLSRRREDRLSKESFKLLEVNIRDHVWSIATAAARKLGYPFIARKYFSPSNLLTFYKAQIRPGLEYCSHIWGAAAPTTLSILDAVQRRAIRLIDDPALTPTKQSQCPYIIIIIITINAYGIDETPVLPYAPGDIESVVENERCRIYWNYSFPTLELVQANKPDIVVLDHQQKTMFVIEFSAPAEVKIVSKEEEKRAKYQELLGQLRRLWPDYAVGLLVMVIGSLGGMRNMLLSALRAIPVCRAAAHIN
nr:unnamed protein product [Callosobruchus chinensis]